MGCLRCGRKSTPKKLTPKRKTTIKLKGRGNLRKRK